MNNEEIKKKVSGNLLWRLLERIGAQGISFIISIIVARLLGPAAYGDIALVIVFTNFMNMLVDGGMGNSLIQKKKVDDLDFSTVFVFNVCTCIILYIIMFVVAPLISNFYNKPNLVMIIRVLSLTIIISGVKNIQQAYVSKNMMFDKFFWATMFGTILSGIVGIIMAYNELGVWAIVSQNLLNQFIDTFILWTIIKWKPNLKFSLKRFKELYKYGSKILVSSILDMTYNNLRQLIIGKKYTSDDLAYYNKGEHIPDLMMNSINASIDSVLLPVLSEEQGDLSRVKNNI